MAITHPSFAGEENGAWRAYRSMLATFLTTAGALALSGCAGKPTSGAVTPAATWPMNSATATLMPATPSVPTLHPSPSQISDISFERDCFGCASGSLLRISRNGSATLTVTGKARHGTVDQVSSSRISPADFERLAHLLTEQGFFELADNHDDPQQQDGAWTTLAATHAGRVKSVFSRADVQPDALRRMGAAIEAWQATALWVATKP